MAVLVSSLQPSNTFYANVFSVIQTGRGARPLTTSHLMAYVFISAFSKVISAVVAPDKVSIDNWSFKLYYRITPMILGVSTVLVCCRQV